MTIKIATIGSCVTRDNFNSNFNPHYKDYFELVAHQHQSSIISMMSNNTSFTKTSEFSDATAFRKRHITNEFNKSFINEIKEKKPEYILIDLYADIKYGVVKFDDETYITNNKHFKNLPELKNKPTLDLYKNFDEYLSLWKYYTNNLFDFIQKELPESKVILVNARYHDKLSDIISLHDIRRDQGIKSLDIDLMNKMWHILDEFILDNYNVIVLDTKHENYFLDKNHPWGMYYLHFENFFYNDFLINLLNIVKTNKNHNIIDKKSGLIKKQRLHYKDRPKLIQSKLVEVITESDLNLIRIARKDKQAYRLYKELLKNDYVLYKHENGISKLYKRKYVNELFKRKDLIRFKDVYYTLDYPKDRKINEYIPKKLLVIFTCMPPQKDYDSYLMPKRMFTKFFDGIERNLVKNVYTMRIMDLNVSHGSHYINTINYNTFEDEIQNAIIKVKNELNIDDENIIFYGVSKGGTGALYHGSSMDIKTLAVDPILNIGGPLEDNDRRFLKDLRTEDLVPYINNHLNLSNNQVKYLICSERVPLYFQQDQRIEQDKIKLYNKIDDFITSHPEVSRNTVPEQIMILNILLGGLNHY
ncbi:XcbB/CpsF family capsular polysaccharide biosynthesis protein [Mammaliicoccus sciuri]|uniref:accessory Sec system protein Asp2 n=1 Tax=Mammaliicoccus sciuri TaxID=1296 RepID=UPI001E4496A6|nr:accessory Sec system protein Asp2 [Mammaliicoccus sciuri]MCD8799435.1 XcbB/CpsF family capsular polysaccharide biosynthesis protein [Mammaliicoccus sciuri]MEB6300876.1 XcbB/CpsF family capsular polysaccharide biosynthesis protein [Mammaliicoccus sciuri]